MIEVNNIDDDQTRWTAIGNPIESFLMQQVQEAGANIRAVWDAINNVVKHFFLVNAILMGFVGVIWVEYGKEVTTVASQKINNVQTCNKLTDEIKSPAKTYDDIVKDSKSIADICSTNNSSPSKLWLIVFLFAGIFGFLASLFSWVTLKRVGPQYGQSFLDTAASAESTLVKILHDRHGLEISYVGVYSAMKKKAEENKRWGIIFASNALIPLTIVFWLGIIIWISAQYFFH